MLLVSVIIMQECTRVCFCISDKHARATLVCIRLICASSLRVQIEHTPGLVNYIRTITLCIHLIHPSVRSNFAKIHGACIQNRSV